MAKGRAWTGVAVAAAMVVGLAAPAARAAEQDEDLRETVEQQAKRIEELEKRLGELEDRGAGGDLDAAIRRYLDEKRAAGEGEGDDEYVLGTVARPSNPRFRFGGYMSILYRQPDRHGKDPTFEAIRMVPQFAFDISPGIEFATEIEFERGGADASFLADNEILIEYAEVRFQVDEAFVPKAGILLIPFLRYNLYHDDPIWNLQDRPFTATRFFKAAFDQPGVGAEGVLPFGDGNAFNYNLAITNGPDDGVTNSSWSGARQDFKQDNNHDKTVWARAGVAPRLGLFDAADFGVSFATGKMDTDGSVRMTGYGVDGKVTRGRFDLIFEWGRFHFDRPATQDFRVMPTGSYGGFVQVDTRLVEGFPPSDNGIVGEASQLILAVRYEWNNLNTRVTGATQNDDARALVVGLAFRPTPKTVVRLERREERSSFDGPHADDMSQWVLSLSTYF